MLLSAQLRIAALRLLRLTWLRFAPQSTAPQSFARLGLTALCWSSLCCASLASPCCAPPVYTSQGFAVLCLRCCAPLCFACFALPCMATQSSAKVRMACIAAFGSGCAKPCSAQLGDAALGSATLRLLRIALFRWATPSKTTERSAGLSLLRFVTLRRLRRARLDYARLGLLRYAPSCCALSS